MDERKTKLEETKAEVFYSQIEWNHKYLHHKSVANFIFHFDNIKNGTDKEWIYTTLLNYLLICKGLNEELDRKMSNKLYYECLEKVAQYYRYHLNFIMIVNSVSYIIIFLIVLFFVTIIFNFIISLFTIPLFFCFFLHLNNKVKQHRTYGIFY